MVVGGGVPRVPYPTTRMTTSVSRPTSRPEGLLADPDVLPGRHACGGVVVVALDLRSVGLGGPAVVGGEQREVLRGDLLVQSVPRSSLLLQRHPLDRVHLLVGLLVAEGSVVGPERLGLVRVGRTQIRGQPGRTRGPVRTPTRRADVDVLIDVVTSRDIVRRRGRHRGGLETGRGQTLDRG